MFCTKYSKEQLEEWLNLNGLPPQVCDTLRGELIYTFILNVIEFLFELKFRPRAKLCRPKKVKTWHGDPQARSVLFTDLVRTCI